MNILHIANDYAGSKVYSHLVKELDDLGVTQTVFTTIRQNNADGNNSVDFKCEGSKIYYSKNWKPYHRLFFSAKTISNYKNLKANIDLKQITYAHAHTLFSDGVLALKLKKNYNIPYTVSIRSTDVNAFMKYLFHTWHIGREIIMNADHVVCISPSHINRVMKWKTCPKKQFKEQVINIPNGIDSYWLEHINCDLHLHWQNTPWQLIYVGNFTPRKNVPRLMNAIIALNKKGIDAQLHIVGGGGKDSKTIEQITAAYPDKFILHGVINDKNELGSLLRQSHIFVMPSLTETFGLVYVEALTQGLPILYTKNEGVDGFFDANYGMSCNPHSSKDILCTLEAMINKYDSFNINSDFLKNHFDWKQIAQKYLKLY